MDYAGRCVLEDVGVGRPGLNSHGQLREGSTTCHWQEREVAKSLNIRLHAVKKTSIPETHGVVEVLHLVKHEHLATPEGLQQDKQIGTRSHVREDDR